MSHVAILSSQSIFAEGVVASLRQQFDDQTLLIVDARQANSLQRVLVAHPSSVILDASDALVAECCPLDRLFDALPSLTVIRLDPKQDWMQVVTSHPHHASHMSDLLKIISRTAKREGGET
jgi:hypothetical protein